MFLFIIFCRQGLYRTLFEIKAAYNTRPQYGSCVSVILDFCSEAAEAVDNAANKAVAVDNNDGDVVASRDVHLFANLRKMRCFALFLRILRKTKQRRAM